MSKILTGGYPEVQTNQPHHHDKAKPDIGTGRLFDHAKPTTVMPGSTRKKVRLGTGRETGLGHPFVCF